MASQNIRITGKEIKNTILLLNASLVGVGEQKKVNTYSTLRLRVWGTGTYVIQIQAVMSNADDVADTIDVVQLKGISVITDIKTTGFYDVDVSGYDYIQAKIISISGGNVNAVGKWIG